MGKQNWLISWIGGTDLMCANNSTSGEIGPIATALKELPRFDRVVLLTNYDFEESSHFVDWLQRETGVAAELVAEALRSPIDYAEIYGKISARLISMRLPDENRIDVTFHVSPGTPAMAANWIILAKTRFPAKLIQTSKLSGVQSVDFAFPLADAFLPEYLRRTDERIKRLNNVHRDFESIIYQSEVMGKIIAQAKRLAAFDVSVMIHGETGTGKDLLAKEIHIASRRADGPYETLNCGAMTSELANSELFGHVKGAFTGAIENHTGCFERADGGTLFLDEIAELSLDVQVRLLRILNDGLVMPVGGKKSNKVNVRIIAATHRDLMNEVAEGRFREDLYYRLAAGYIELPPLRDRGSDIELLIRRFLDQCNADVPSNPSAHHMELSDEAVRMLASLPWRGNVRELRHTIVRLSIWAEGTIINCQDVERCVLVAPKAGANVLQRPLGRGFSLQALLDDISRHYLKRADSESRGKKKLAAELLGLGTHQTFSNWWAKLLGEK